MGHLKKVKTAQEYYDYWYPRLSPQQAESLENIKTACDAIEGIGPDNKMNPGKVGDHCKKYLKVPPAAQTIRNMTILVEGQKEHVFNNYIKKRNVEYSGKRAKPRKGDKAPAPPSFSELANNIKDDDTRGWVLELIQRWQHAENSCDFMAKQLEQKSKEVGGFDMAAAITEGPSDENLHLPMMPPTQGAAVECSEDFLSAIKAILAIPENQDVPFLTLNDRGAMVWDSGTGPVVLLSPKQWAAIEKAVQGGD